MVAVRTFVGLTGVVVAAAYADVMLIASFHFLDALNFLAGVFHGCVDALALLVALDGGILKFARRRAHHVRWREMSVLPCHRSP